MYYHLPKNRASDFINFSGKKHLPKLLITCGSQVLYTKVQRADLTYDVIKKLAPFVLKKL